MLILLLPATFTLVFLALCGYHVNRRTPLTDWRLSFLQAATLLGGYLVIFSETLSLFHALTTFWVAFFWSAALILTSVIGWRKGWFKSGIESLRRGWTKPGWFDILAGSMIIVILGLLFFIAVKSPVNNNDSLLYHMSRVMHWVQDQSLDHFASNYEHQLINPILAELAITATVLLVKGTYLANTIQWVSLAGSLVAVFGISILLGLKKFSTWMAIAYAVSIPLVTLQTTNPQNDLVTAFWLLCFLYFVLLSSVRKLTFLEILTLSLSLGLGLLTKGTFYAYAIVPTIFLIYFQHKNTATREMVRNLLLIGSIIVMVNSGYWTRNILTFGTPLGPTNYISNHTSKGFSPGTAFGSSLKGIVQNFATPDEVLNEKTSRGIQKALSLIDPSAKEFTLIWAWNHEDLAGNPIHILIGFFSMIILVIRYKRNPPIVNRLLLVDIGIYIALSIVVFYGMYGMRFQIPIILAFSPLVGSAAEKLNKGWLMKGATILLLLSAFPWVLFNRTRPLIAMRDSSDPFTIPCLAGCTTGSILIEPPEKTMFAVWGDLGFAYVESMNQVKSTGCMDIGLRLDSNDLEYAYWWLLGAPQNGMRLETIVTYPELERYLDPSFKPCAIICTTCGDQSQLFGLEKIGDYGNGRIKIFAGENYDPALP